MWGVLMEKNLHEISILKYRSEESISVLLFHVENVKMNIFVKFLEDNDISWYHDEYESIASYRFNI